MTTAHQQLKAATAAAHARIDAMIATTGPWSTTRYQRFLRAMHAVVAAQAPALRARLAAGRVNLLDTAADRLAHDLAAVGGDLPAPSPHAPAIDDDATAFGAAYVVLGSHLGGLFVSRAVRGTLDLAPAQLTYLEPPVAVAPQWRAFLGALEQWRAGASETQWHRTIATALATFAAVEAALVDEGLAAVPR